MWDFQRSNLEKVPGKQDEFVILPKMALRDLVLGRPPLLSHFYVLTELFAACGVGQAWSSVTALIPSFLSS